MPKSSTKLSDYRKKRDAQRTNEPAGTEPALSGAQGTRNGAFVVHLHDARRAHYDLRIEMGGVLKSFAVPRGPSLDPADKRLAVQTEDHPIEYLDFEEIIPDGNYGAGPMIMWDRGRIRYLETSGEEGVARGKIDFELYGHKLRGRFALVHTGARANRDAGEARQWLLFKKQDGFARADRPILEEEPRSVLSGLEITELAARDEIARKVEEHAARLKAPAGAVDGRHLAPMLCALEGAKLHNPGWVYELKLDGVRILADKKGDDVALTYRHGRAATASYPEIARAVRALPVPRLVLDGEIVAFDERGRPSFQRLAGRIHNARPRALRFLLAEVPVVYFVFDLLAVGERDLRGLPLYKRRELLADVVRGRGMVRLLDFIEDDGRPLYEFCTAQKLEGLVAKRGDSPYYPGPRRTDNWIKVKCERDEEFVVIAFTRGEGVRSKLGALDVASYEGPRLIARGKVGSGLDDAMIKDLLRRLEPLEVASCAAEGELERAPRGRTFVKPEVVVSVRFSGWTDDGHLRHPVIRGVREDVLPEACTAIPDKSADIEVEAEIAAQASAEAEADAETHAEALAADPKNGTGPAQAAEKRSDRRVVISNKNKIFWPDDGITKGELIAYYDQIAPTLLPYLKNRPVVLVRYPDGIAGKNFYQWNVPQGTPSWVRTLRLKRAEDSEREVNVFLVDDEETLRYIANLGCIPLHVLAAREPHLDHCDFITFDFDLGGGTLRTAIELALALAGLLKEIGLEGYPKTSGQSGLHVLVPMGPGVPFDAARALVELLGRLLEMRYRKVATMERRVAERGDRVYIDTGQTGRSRTIVSPYSVRAHPGARVSTPLTWDEVAPLLAPERYTMFTVPTRVSEIGDPMRPMLDARPDVPSAVARLEALIVAGGKKA